MTIITVERLTAAHAVVNKMVEQAQALAEDITETVNDRARLFKIVNDSQRLITQLKEADRIMRERLTVVEEAANKLNDDLVLAEARLADANARLESISMTARGQNIEIEPPVDERGGRAGIAALTRLAAEQSNSGTRNGRK